VPRNPGEFATPPIMFVRMMDEFTGVNYAVPLTGAFEVTTPLQAMQLEAQAKGLGIVIQAALVPLENFFGVPKEEPDGQQSGTEAGNP